MKAVVIKRIDAFISGRPSAHVVFILVISVWAPGLWSGGLCAQAPPEESAAMETVFRSSEQPGETPVGRRARNRVKTDVPPGSYRVGCFCMDGSFSGAQSIGACSGHGGVRYWLYRTPDADTIWYATDRHAQRPGPLGAEEMSRMARRSDFVHHPSGADSARPPAVGPAPVGWLPPDDPNDTFDLFDWSDVAGLTAGGGWLYAILRLIMRYANENEPLIRDALDHILRRSRRPDEKPDRQDTDEARL